MGITKLIERLRTESLYKDKATLEIMDLCMDAASALSALKEENTRLRIELLQTTNQLAKEKYLSTGYRIYYEIMTSLGNCNDCGRNDCPYKPHPGQNVRVNCMLYKKRRAQQ